MQKLGLPAHFAYTRGREKARATAGNCPRVWPQLFRSSDVSNASAALRQTEV
jgi:hypothetical protein